MYWCKQFGGRVVFENKPVNRLKMAFEQTLTQIHLFFPRPCVTAIWWGKLNLSFSTGK